MGTKQPSNAIDFVDQLSKFEKALLVLNAICSWGI
jgi:hypothetical protein